MAKPHFFPFYAEQFLNGTRFFTDAQTGAYIRLLLDQWELGELREKHFKVRLQGISEEEREEIRGKFERIPTVNGEVFRNRKMWDTKKYVAKLSKIRSEAGRLGGRPPDKQKDKQNESKDESKIESKIEANQGILNPKSEILNIKSKISNSLSEKKSKPKPPSFPWPEDFVLTNHLRSYASKQGVPDPEDEFENFRLNALAKSYVYADWSSAWMKWCRDERTNKKPKEEEGGLG